MNVSQELKIIIDKNLDHCKYRGFSVNEVKKDIWGCEYQCSFINRSNKILMLSYQTTRNPNIPINDIEHIKLMREVMIPALKEINQDNDSFQYTATQV